MIGDGSLYYTDKTHFEGEWEFTGEKKEGKLYDRDGDTITEWEDGEEVFDEEEYSPEEYDSEEGDDDEDPAEKRRKPSV